jgi:predicted alpha/beta-hydrolase family hydrolase
MRRYAELLGNLGSVRSFDYPYMRNGGRRAPDKLVALVAAHRVELEAERAPADGTQKLVLAGKSMGGRVGCHVALEASVAGLICFGYPLRGQNGKLRDQVLLALATPILFVQGTRDPMCPLDELDRVRQQMSARSEVFVVEDGDHSLEATKTSLRARGTTQPQVELAVLDAVRGFCAAL